MAQICAAGIPNASEFARRRVPRQPKGRGRALPAALRSASGAISQQHGGRIEAMRPPVVMGDLSPSLTATAAAGILYPFRYPSCRALR